MTDVLQRKLLQFFGAIYRHWIPERRLFVDGIAVQVVDPLFLMEHGRFYNETTVLAQKVDTRTFEVTTPSGATGTVSIEHPISPEFSVGRSVTQGGEEQQAARRDEAVQRPSRMS